MLYFLFMRFLLCASIVLFSGVIGFSQTEVEIDTLALIQQLSDAKSSDTKIPILKKLIVKNAYVNNGRMLHFLNLLEEIASQEKLFEEQAYVLGKKATLEYYGGDLDKARSNYMKSYDLYMQADSFDLAHINWAKAAVMHTVQSNYEEAEKIYREVERAINKKTHPRATAFLYNNIGTLYHYMGKLDSADLYYTRAIKNYKELRDTIGLLRPMGNQGILWNYIGNNEKHIKRLEEIAKIQRDKKSYIDLVITLNALANAEVLNNSNFESSQRYAEEAYLLSKEINEKNATISSLMNLGTVSNFQKDYDKAIEYYKESENLSKELELKDLLMNSKFRLGETYFSKTDYKKAEESFIESIAIGKAMSDNRNYPAALLALCNLYFETQRYEPIKPLLDEAFKVAKEQDNIGALIPIYTLRSELLIREKKWSEALRNLNSAIENLDQGRNELTSKIYRLQSLIYEKLGNYKKSLVAFKQHKSLQDSISNSNNIRELTTNQKNFEFAQEKEILALEQEKKEAILKAESTQIKTAAIGIGAIALLALGFFWNSTRKNKIIAKANDQLSALNNTKDQIFSIIGHDLKKPAIAFRGITEKLRYLIDSGDKERLLKYGESVEKDALELNNLTDNLLSWALLQKDLVTFKEEKIDLANVSQEVVSLFSNIAKEKNISLISEIQKIFVNSDKNALATVLRNLVDNALKYTDAYGRVIITAIENKGKVELLIKDNGKGIEQERLPNLFALSKEKSTQGTSGEKGTGLGLHIVKDLVERCKGSIDVESVFEEGTTFRILLPS